MSNTKDTPMDYKQCPILKEYVCFECKVECKMDIKSKIYVDGGKEGDYIAQKIAFRIEMEMNYAKTLDENASLKLELQKQKELCKTAIALLDNIMSDMKEEGGNQWYTDQIEELIKQSEPLIYKPDEI